MKHEAKRRLSSFAGKAIATTSALLLPLVAMAQDTAATGKVTSFFNNINGLLNAASLAVVTIAVIFAGYQIAFAHKRFSDVAPVLIGGFLIGAAAQLAKMLVPGDSTTETGMIIVESLLRYA